MGGLCDAAAQPGLLGLCMQLCGEAHPCWLLQDFGAAPHVVSWLEAPSRPAPNVRLMEWHHVKITFN